MTACRALLPWLAICAGHLILNAAAARESPSDREYTVFCGGAERAIRILGGNRVLETGAGRSVDQPVWLARPEVMVSAARKSMVPALVERYEATSWRAARVGGFYFFSYASLPLAFSAAERMWLDGLEASPLIARRKHSRFVPADPYWPEQWHLRNSGQRAAVPGLDLNVVPVWTRFLGRGVVIGIVDDGLQVDHPDLAANTRHGLHYDFLRSRPDPSPLRSDVHGTPVAGLAAAAANREGGLGVAPQAGLAGLRLTAQAATDDQEASAFSWKNDAIHIYNNSWGPSDDGSTLEGPGGLAAAALLRAVNFGRGGLGSVFVWAGGNGRGVDDANFDGYANSIHTIAVGALSDTGRQTSESEPGANLLVVAPSSSLRRQGLATTDLRGSRGYNRNGSNDGAVIPRSNLANTDYTNDFGMTSGAAPLVSGVVALMLEANPRLGWRDVQEILLRTARRVHQSDAGWKQNGAKFWFNHKYGAGLVDAAAAVSLAENWSPLPGATHVAVARSGLSVGIPDAAPSGALVEFDLSAQPDLRAEHVEVVVSVRHGRRGDLRFTLTSPSGMVSVIGPRRLDGGRNFAGWPFRTVRHWGESSRGVWSLKIEDVAAGYAGTLTKVKLVVHGSRILRTARR
jgi:subtilisin-like proprotein convertase family protein